MTEHAEECGFALYGPPAACTCGLAEITPLGDEPDPLDAMSTSDDHHEDCQCAWCLDDELIP